MIQSFENWLGQAPIWQVGVILLGLMLLFAGAGYAARRWHAAHTSVPVGEKEGNQEGYLVSAVLGLLAFLLGFTFALAVDRFDTRRSLVLAEANAIGTTYLRTQLLEAPHRARISQLLVAYTDNRIALAKNKEPTGSDDLAKNNKLITDLWHATVAAFPSIKGYDFSSSYLESMNTVIDLDTSRKVGRRAHVPTTVFVVLGLYTFVTAGVLGYVLSGARGRSAAVVVLALFALAFLLILDIDRPTMGTINESQEPMELLRASLNTWQPHVFDTPPD
jgi:hypothetical protein